jgi:CRISPR-associated exonuclease Cas4
MSSLAYPEADLIPISALQHFVVCPRQCALIHLEAVWIENERTAEGRVAHERVDRGGAETRDAVRRAYGVPVRSLRLGLSGRADAVEFHAVPGGGPERPFPIEHKRGRPKRGDEDRVQLCAQALCLEEMLGVPVPSGALFYGQSRRRAEVVFDAALRRRTEAVAADVRALFDAGATPPPPAVAPCKSCSLLSPCQPTAFRARRRSVASWIAGRLAENDIPGDPL